MKPHPGKIERWRGSAAGRSRMVAFGELVWAVSNASVPGADFEAQAVETLQRLDQSLREAGSDRGRLLSVQVILADVSTRSGRPGSAPTRNIGRNAPSMGGAGAGTVAGGRGNGGPIHGR